MALEQRWKQAGQPGYRVCTRCVMDTSDADIAFDAEGVCNHCRRFDVQIAPMLAKIASGAARSDLERIVERIKADGRDKPYDVVLGVSGGVDSSYVAYLASTLGLRALCVHFDSGWNTELAVRNIESLLRSLRYDLVTYVVEWSEMKDLQVAFFKAGVANCDTPTDHAIPGVLNRTARRFGIKYILSGSNVQTEAILPLAWAYHPNDHVHLLDIHKKHGSRRLENYPLISFWANYLLYPKLYGIETIKILNYVDYNKARAKQAIQDHLGWVDYGGKHEESVFTRFFQQFYLPMRFGFDKRRPHLASLVLSGQMTREEALTQLELPPYDTQRIEFDVEFIAKKLDLDVGEFKRLLAEPGRPHYHFASLQKVFDTGLKIKRALRA